MTQRRPPGDGLRAVKILVAPIGGRSSAGDRLAGACRAVRARGGTSTAALDQHHSRRSLDAKNRAKHRGVVPVGPTPPARRQRRPRRQWRGSAWDVVIHLISPSLSDIRPGLVARLALRVSQPHSRQYAPHSVRMLGAHNPGAEWPALLEERTNRQPGGYFARRTGPPHRSGLARPARAARV